MLCIPSCLLLHKQSLLLAGQIVHNLPPSSSRSNELSAALQLYQQAAAVKLDEPQQAAAVKLGGLQHPDPEGSQSAQAVAEASLKLALLCNDLLQVLSLQMR